MYVCLLVCFLRSTGEFSVIWRRHHYRWRAANFDPCSALMAIEQWACHTYCDTGHPFIMVISEDPLHSHLLPGVLQLSCHYLLLRLLSRLGFEHTTFRMRGDCADRLRHRHGFHNSCYNNCTMRVIAKATSTSFVTAIKKKLFKWAGYIFVGLEVISISN